jgi:Tfp pilus assembly protein PilN
MNRQELMFTIDLLNGQGIPLKTKPGGVVIVAVTAVLPVLLAIGIVSIYLNNKFTLSLKDREIVKSKAGIEEYSDALEQQKALLKKKVAYGSCLSEVGSSVKKYTQWSPILTTVIENIPEEVVLTSLEVERDSVTIEVPKKDNPKKKKEIEVPIRVLRLKVCSGPQSNCDEAVRSFQDRLRTSDLLGPKLENIRVSRGSETINNQDVFSYEITCVFKPSLNHEFYKSI